MSSIYSLLNIGKIVAGAGSIEQITNIVADYEAKNVVIITDQGVWGSGLVDNPKALLEGAGVNVHVINDTPPEPTVDQVNAIFQAAKEFECQMIIGIGGGSSMDAAKIVSLLLTNSVNLRELVKGKAQIKRRGVYVPLVKESEMVSLKLRENFDETVPNYSTEIDAAQQVVEHMKSLGYTYLSEKKLEQDQNRYYGNFVKDGIDVAAPIGHSSEAEAIVKAALAALA